MTALRGASVLGRANALHVIQGRYAVSGDPNAFISTLLGSCVAACIRDPAAGVGGLNHFLLPGGGNGSESLSYGVNAMELLINELLQRGARRDRLEAKLFGGGRMLRGVTDIGRQNAEFAQRFLNDEGIAHVGGSLGGSQARRVEFWPVSGRARQHLIDRSDDIFATEQRQPAPKVEHGDGGLELF